MDGFGRRVALLRAEKVPMKRTIAGLVVILLVGFLLTTLHAQNDFLGLGKGSLKGTDQPIDIQSRKLNCKMKSGSVDCVYDGNVRVKQGDVTMTCDRLAIVYENKEDRTAQDPKGGVIPHDLKTIRNIKSITASGNVKIVQGDRVAIAGTALFDNGKQTITLSEGPKLWQGTNQIIGEKIIIYLKENTAEVKTKDGTMIETIINPGQPNKESEKPSPAKEN
jgi:lipopolysaccharide export system protein LptA